MQMMNRNRPNKFSSVFTFFLAVSRARTFARLFVTIMALTVSAIAQSESPGVPNEWRTLPESTDYRKTWSYDETVAFAKKLDAASPSVLFTSFGKTGEGRDLPLLIAASGGEFTPAAAKKSGKAIVLIQAGIHSGEIDGKDAGLALFRDIAVTKSRAELLKNCIVVFIPIYNADGHEMSSPYNRINQNGPDEMGWRATSAGLNLNRDYIKADASETRAFLKLWNSWKPDFFFDLHVTDGADFQYNITYEYAHFQEVAPSVKNWMDEHFDGRIKAEAEKEGNLLTHYLEFGGREVTSGIFTFIATPRYATGFAALRNRPGLLIETHSLKPYRSRVRGTYDVLWKTLVEISASKVSLFAANKQADDETIARAKTYDSARQFPLQLGLTDKSVPFELKAVEYSFEDSAISGTKKLVYGTKPSTVTVKKFDEGKVNASAAPPLAYIVPPQWARQIAPVLDAHGVKYRVTDALEIEVESCRLTEPKFATQSFEGRITVSTKIVPLTEKRNYPKGSIVVPLAQETANVIMHLFEPASQDSLVYWGFFNPIFETKEYFSDYIMEKIAADMLAKDAKLRAEFDEKLKDEAFSKNRRARLAFFYDRSPYSDKRIGVYPVGRIVK